MLPILTQGQLPIISIILPVRNAVETIAGAIESVIAQTYACFELIIIDGESTDGTLDVIERYRKSLHQVVSEADGGIYEAMNKGISLATGDWLLFLGADDYLNSPDVLKEVFSKFDVENKFDYDLVYGYGVRSGRRCNNFINWRILKGNSLNHQCAFYRKRVFNQSLYDTSYRVGADYKLNLTLYVNRAKMLYVDCPIAVYGENGFSSKDRELSWKEMDRARLEVLGPIFGYFINSLRSIRKSIIELRG